MLLKVSSELYYISKQNLELAECTYKLNQEKVSAAAQEELVLVRRAVKELIKLSMSTIMGTNPAAAESVLALIQVIHRLKRDIYERHVYRLQNDICSAEAGAVWMDSLIALERISDHFANICSHIIEYRDEAEEQERYSEDKMKEIYCMYEEKFNLL